MEVDGDEEDIYGDDDDDDNEAIKKLSWCEGLQLCP